MRTAAFFLAIGLLGSSAAQALDKSFMLSREEAEDLQIVEGGIKVNNLSLSEKPALFKKGLFNLTVSLSAKNRAKKPQSLTVMLAGIGAGKGDILWAISAAPAFFTVAPGSTAPISGSAYVTAGTLSKTKKIWVRVVGHP